VADNEKGNLNLKYLRFVRNRRKSLEFLSVFSSRQPDLRERERERERGREGLLRFEDFSLNSV
jgi:hypothetical protein